MKKAVASLGLVSLFVAACGGESTADSRAAVFAQAPAAQGLGDDAPRAALATWTFVADELQPFTLTQWSVVRYGSNSTWIDSALPPGQHICSNSYFGRDPLPGIDKRCEVIDAASPSTGWVAVAAEWGSFVLTVPRQVRYGAQSTWVERDLPPGQHPCTNAFFGTDPRPGIVKGCEVFQGRWTFFVDEWSAFTLLSPTTLRYGANDTWIERQLPAGQGHCSNDFFGIDPLPNVVKRCESIGDATQPPPPPPAPPPAPPTGTLPTNIGSHTVVSLSCGTEYRGSLKLDNLSNITVQTVGACGPAIINAAVDVKGWESAGVNIWRSALPFVPRQVLANGKLLELAHTPRVAGNPYLRITQHVGNNLTLQGLQLAGDVVGATLRVRSNSYIINDTRVTAGSGNTVTVSGLPSDLTPGQIETWGAYLEGKRWMLDEPGEWAYENGALYVHSTGTPQNIEASEVGAAISADGINGLNLTNIVIKNAVVGLRAHQARNVSLSAIQLLEATDFGIDAECVSNLSFDQGVMTNIGRDGLRVAYCGDRVSVTRSTFTNIGTILMPRKSEAAVFGGFTTNMTVSDSTFVNSGYIAIRFFRNGTIRDNVIDGACLVLDDCGAIYTFDRQRLGLNALVTGNRITRVTGSSLGRTDRATWEGESSAHGIYLDDNANGVTVSGNTVSGTTSGVVLHGAFGNLIERNSFSNNPAAQINMTDWGLPGSVRNNIIRHNSFGSGPTYAYGVQAGDNTTLWATYVGNQCAAGAIGCK